MHPKERLGRVLLTASWFNNINMGYRFHTSTVCHSCCNNVMYISGYKWLSRKIMSCWHGIPVGTECPSTDIIQGESCVRPMQASAARLRPDSGISFMTYIDICII